MQTEVGTRLENVVLIQQYDYFVLNPRYLQHEQDGAIDNPPYQWGGIATVTGLIFRH